VQPGGDADPVPLASLSVGDHSTPDLLQVLQAAQGDLQVVHLSFDKFGRTIEAIEEQTEISQYFQSLHNEAYTQ
jgi:hypothetical protein